MWEPVGPLAPSVYWRRRCLALGVVLAVLGGLVWAATGAGGSEPDPTTTDPTTTDPTTMDARAAALAGAPTPAPPAASPSPGPTPAALAAGPAAPVSSTVLPPGGGPGLSPTSTGPGGALLAPPGGDGFRFLPPGVPAGSAGPLLDPTTPPSTAAPATATGPTQPPPSGPPATSAAPASRAAPGPCADGDLRVSARTDAPRYPAGRKPVLSLVVTNTSAVPCVRDLDAARQAVAVVIRPGEGLWGSNDCSPGDTDDVRTLAPGQEAVFSVRWSGRTSSPGCTGERRTVPPGTYQLLARLDGILSEPATFTLDG